MSTLAALNVKIFGDASGVRTELGKLRGWIKNTEADFTRLNGSMNFKRGATSLTQLGKSAKNARFHSANLFAQFQDIGVMMASGQSPFILAAQQGSQISQVLQSLGGDAKTQFRALGQAAKQFISPVNILTVGIIAVGAALVQWGIKALTTKDELGDLEKQVEDLTEKMIEGRDAIDLYRSGLNSLAELRIERQLKAAQAALKNLNAEMEKARKGPGIANIGKENNLRSRIAEQKEIVKRLSEQLEEYRKIEEARAGILRNEKALEAVYGVQHGQLAKAAALYRNRKIEAEALLEIEKNIARAQLMGLSGFATGPDDARAKLFEEGRLGGSVVGGDTESTDDKKKKGKKDDFADRLKNLQEELTSEIDLEKISFDQKQKLLETALERKMITLTKFQEMEAELKKQHEGKMAQLDVWRYGSTAQKTEAFFGELASITASGNEKMVRISKAAGAAQALISAWQGAAEALKLPFPANMLAYAKVLTTGLSAVQAIKAINSNGTGPTSAAPSGAGGSLGGAAASPSPQVSLTLIGDRGFTRAQIVQVAEAINDAGAEGQTPISIRGRR